MRIKKTKTQRRFPLLQFTDRYDAKCSIQKSSLATEDAIWFGVDDADPKILIPGSGWQHFEIPKQVLLTTRMHLTQKQVRKLLPILTMFAETGDIL